MAAGALFALVLTAGCGASNDSQGGFETAPHAAPPLVPRLAGPVVSPMQLVTITFANDPNAALEEAFGDWLVQSAWMSAAAEYGIASARHVMKVRIPSEASGFVSVEDIRSFLDDAIARGVIPAPATPTSYVYAVYFPTSVSLGEPPGVSSSLVHCRDFTGYHSEADGRYGFAAIGDCPSYVDGLDEPGNIMRTASHEILETATDPLVLTNPAYAATTRDSPWFFLGAEVADICELNLVFRGSGFLAERFWSNSAAQAGKDPCVPAPDSEVYYNTSASPTATQTLARGESVTFTLQGFSAAATAEWQLALAKVGGTLDPAVTLDATTMQNGRTARLTVTLPQNAPPASYAFYWLVSSRSATDRHVWPVAVRTR